MPAYARSRSTKSTFRILYLGSDLELVKALRGVLAKPDYRLVNGETRGLEAGAARAFKTVSPADADRVVGSERIER